MLFLHLMLSSRKHFHFRDILWDCGALLFPNGEGGVKLLGPLYYKYSKLANKEVIRNIGKIIKNNKMSKGLSLKGQCHEIFCFWFFSWISLPQAPEYTIRAVSNFFENSRRYSHLKVDHRYQRHRRQILPPVLLVLLIPVANKGNNIRLQIPLSELEGKSVYMC
jgi:hypothetical protein